jgi:dihydrofolate reductase
MIISMIAAIGKNRELGKDNKLLWHLKEDFQRFKNLTSGNVVIMGRKTYDSLPEKNKPLPNRINIIISRNKSWSPLGSYVYNSLEEAILEAKKFNKEIFIIGGASVYEQGIKYADKLYLTVIDKEYPDADAFFPDYPEFKKIIFEEKHQEKDLVYRFIDLVK